MANYKGHLVGAVAVNAGYVAGLRFIPGEALARAHVGMNDWQLFAGLFVVAMLFGLFPDVDTNSKGQNIFFGLAFIIDILLIFNGYLVAAAYFGLLAMTPIIGRHRGWTHSKPAMILVPAPIVLVPFLGHSSMWPTYLIFYGAAVAGYFSHLLLDGLIVRWIRVSHPRY